MRLSNLQCCLAALLLITWLSTAANVLAAESAKTPEEFASLYMAAFNAKNTVALKKMSYPVKSKSPMQEMMDDMTSAEMSGGLQYNKFEVTPAPKDMEQAHMGPDGAFYRPNLKPTNMIKFTSQSKGDTTSTSFPIGLKDGIYYAVGIEAAPGAMPAFISGWQRCSLPKSNWSVMMPNEPEPGRASLEKQGGKDVMNDPDAYGVVKNTADIKTFQHWMSCGEEGKRIFDDSNKESYRAACTTYAPETLSKWFSNAEKNIDDAVESNVRQNDGTLVAQKTIDLNGAPGKEFQIRDKDGTKRWGRAYWIKDALYELTFESRKDKPDLDSANKFLSSLQVN